MPTLQQRMVDSTEPATRKKAMNALSDFLRDDLEDLAMRKLWRSIFFAGRATQKKDGACHHQNMNTSSVTDRYIGG